MPCRSLEARRSERARSEPHVTRADTSDTARPVRPSPASPIRCTHFTLVLSTHPLAFGVRSLPQPGRRAAPPAFRRPAAGPGTTFRALTPRPAGTRFGQTSRGPASKVPLISLPCARSQLRHPTDRGRLRRAWKPPSGSRHRGGCGDRGAWADRRLRCCPGRPGPRGVEGIKQLVAEHRIDSIVIVLLWSFVNSEHKKGSAEALAPAAPDVHVSSAVVVSPRLGAEERTVAAVTNAYVGPACSPSCSHCSGGSQPRVDALKPASKRLRAPSFCIRSAAKR